MFRFNWISSYWLVLKLWYAETSQPSGNPFFHPFRDQWRWPYRRSHAVGCAYSMFPFGCWIWFQKFTRAPFWNHTAFLRRLAKCHSSKTAAKLLPIRSCYCSRMRVSTGVFPNKSRVEFTSCELPLPPPNQGLSSRHILVEWGWSLWRPVGSSSRASGQWWCASTLRTMGCSYQLFSQELKQSSNTMKREQYSQQSTVAEKVKPGLSSLCWRWPR